MGSDSKPRFLCLHGFRTSGQILEKQISRWPQSILSQIDLVFLDAPFPSQGKSEVEGIFDPPFFEWFQFNKEFTEYTNFEECLAYIEDCIIKNSPIHGLLGFSQGAILSAALPGFQSMGKALIRVPKIKYLVIISGAMLRAPHLTDYAYASPITCHSVHFLGEADYLKQYGLHLLDACVNPLVIHHPKGHTVPRLDEKSLEVMLKFVEKIRKDFHENEGIEMVELDGQKIQEKLSEIEGIEKMELNAEGIQVKLSCNDGIEKNELGVEVIQKKLSGNEEYEKNEVDAQEIQKKLSGNEGFEELVIQSA